jgi:hypothetical protein
MERGQLCLRITDFHYELAASKGEQSYSVSSLSILQGADGVETPEIRA